MSPPGIRHYGHKAAAARAVTDALPIIDNAIDGRGLGQPSSQVLHMWPSQAMTAVKSEPCVPYDLVEIELVVVG
jgi:hypothetical protein